eukprot:2735049-Rhodomonas_salina.2
MQLPDRGKFRASSRLANSSSVILLAALLLAGFQGTFAAMREEYLDPDRDFHISVKDDLRRMPHTEVNEQTGLITYSRDYIRRNHRTSEYTKFEYRSTQRKDGFIHFKKNDQKARIKSIVCEQDFLRVSICSSLPTPTGTGTSLQNASETSAQFDSDSANLTSSFIGSKHFQTGAMIMGDIEWGCLSDVGGPAPFYRRQTGELEMDWSTLVSEGCMVMSIPVKKESFFSFVGNSDLYFFTNHSLGDVTPNEAGLEQSGQASSGGEGMRRSTAQDYQYEDLDDLKLELAKDFDELRFRFVQNLHEIRSRVTLQDVDDFRSLDDIEPNDAAREKLTERSFQVLEELFALRAKFAEDYQELQSRMASDGIDLRKGYEKAGLKPAANLRTNLAGSNGPAEAAQVGEYHTRVFCSRDRNNRDAWT